MHPNYSLVTPPDSEPITSAQATKHVRVDSEADQDYIGGLIAVAREYVDGITGRVSMESAWRLSAATWQALFGPAQVDTISLHRTPLVSVESISYYANGETSLTVIDPADYIVVTGYEPGLIKITGDLPTLADRPDAIQIEFTAGYSTADLVPAIQKHAIKLLVDHLYDQRAPVAFASCQNLPFSLETFISNQKVGGWVA